MLRDEKTSMKMSEAIHRLQELNIAYRQPTVHQLKVGLYNFYPSTGTIVLDGGTRHPTRGLDAFIELVRKILRPRTMLSGARASRSHEAPSEPSAVLVVDWHPNS